MLAARRSVSRSAGKRDLGFRFAQSGLAYLDALGLFYLANGLDGSYLEWV